MIQNKQLIALEELSRRTAEELLVESHGLQELNRKLKEVEKSLNNPKSYEKEEDLDFHALLRDQVSLTNEIKLSEEQWFDLNQKLEEG